MLQLQHKTYPSEHKTKTHANIVRCLLSILLCVTPYIFLRYVCECVLGKRDDPQNAMTNDTLTHLHKTSYSLPTNDCHNFDWCLTFGRSLLDGTKSVPFELALTAISTATQILSSSKNGSVLLTGRYRI